MPEVSICCVLLSPYTKERWLKETRVYPRNFTCKNIELTRDFVKVVQADADVEVAIITRDDLFHLLSEVIAARPNYHFIAESSGLDCLRHLQERLV